LFVDSSIWIHGSELFELFACILNLLCRLFHLSVDLKEANEVDVRRIGGLCARVHDFFLDFFFSSIGLIYLSCMHASFYSFVIIVCMHPFLDGSGSVRRNLADESNPHNQRIFIWGSTHPFLNPHPNTPKAGRTHPGWSQPSNQTHGYSFVIIVADMVCFFVCFYFGLCVICNLSFFLSFLI